MAGEKHKYDTDAIIEIPDDIGSTVFETASLFSVKICNYILDRNIRVNNILVNFVYPVFPIPDLATFNDYIRKLFESNNRKLISIDIVYALFNEKMLEKMLQKGINPKIISGRDFIFESQPSKYIVIISEFFESLNKPIKLIVSVGTI